MINRAVYIGYEANENSAIETNSLGVKVTDHNSYAILPQTRNHVPVLVDASYILTSEAGSVIELTASLEAFVADGGTYEIIGGVHKKARALTVLAFASARELRDSESLPGVCAYATSAIGSDDVRRKVEDGVQLTQVQLATQSQLYCIVTHVHGMHVRERKALTLYMNAHGRNIFVNFAQRI